MKIESFNEATQVMIKLAFRQRIDASCISDFERKIFNDTYSELLLQSQVYNREKKFTTVAELIAANPKANSLHYKVGFAIGLYVNELNKKIPQLRDSLGDEVQFEIYKTNIIQSDLTDKSAHQIGLTYITQPLLLLGVWGSYLLLSDGVKSEDGYKTFTIALQPSLSVIQYTEEAQLV